MSVRLLFTTISFSFIIIVLLNNPLEKVAANGTFCFLYKIDDKNYFYLKSLSTMVLSLKFKMMSADTGSRIC